MKGKTLFALAVAALAATGGAVYLTMFDPAVSAADPAAGQPVYPGLAARLNEVASVTLVRRDGTITLARGDRDWRVVEKNNYPAAFDKVRKLLVDMAEMRTLEAKTSQPSIYGSLDLDDLSVADSKAAVITLKDAGGAQIASLVAGKVRLGRASAASDATYVRKSGEARAWLVSGRIQPDKDADRWLDRRIADILRDRVREATVAPAAGETYTIRREEPFTDFALVDAPADRKPKPAFERNAIAGALEGVELDDLKPAAEVAFPPDPASIQVKTFDGVIARAELAEVEGKTWVRFSARFEAPASPPAAGPAGVKSSADAAREADEIAARTKGWIYRLPEYKSEAMRRKLDDLLEPKAAP